MSVNEMAKRNIEHFIKSLCDEVGISVPSGVLAVEPSAWAPEILLFDLFSNKYF
jgi:hypothetical protein